jgi:outer membrane protein assembly factor BamD
MILRFSNAPWRAMINPRVVAVSIFALFFLLAGCAKRPLQAPLGVQEAWTKARDLFERERYLRAQEVLSDITLNYPGTAIIDSVQYYLGRTTFEMGEYLLAADQFHRVVELYPTSPVSGDAEYYEGRCYYDEAPAYQLDQEYTNKALQIFQRFLEDYPQHRLTDSGYVYLARCREKLARKEYSAAGLYYDLGEFASAILYADYVLSNYYDSPLAGPAQFLKARSYYALQDWERARVELKTYVDKYPDGRFVLRARQMLTSADGTAGASNGGASGP